MPPSDKTKSQQPATFTDSISLAMQDIATGLAAPDADIDFATQLLQVMGMFVQTKHQAPQKPGAGAGAGAPGGGGPQPPSPGGGGAPSPTPGGPAGGSPQNAQMPSMGAPTPAPGPGQGPASGGPTNGLTPDPDEMRRVLQEVAGQ
jgi:hypothetical protein